MTMQPAAAARGARLARDRSTGAEEREVATARKSKAFELGHRVGLLWPRKLTRRPSERLLASGKSLETGKGALLGKAR